MLGHDPKKLTGRTCDNLDFSGPDLRDTRDPETIGHAILVAAKAKHNGSTPAKSVLKSLDI